jgi:hypothetical protein
MQTFPLGSFHVGRVGFGTMQLPGPGMFGPPRDHDEALAVLRDFGVLSCAERNKLHPHHSTSTQSSVRSTALRHPA